jgi:cation transport regulator
MPKNNPRVKRDLEIYNYRLEPKKQINSLPQHAQHIFKRAHDSEVKQYQDPEKRRGGKKQGAEVVAHKTAWAASIRIQQKAGR